MCRSIQKLYRLDGMKGFYRGLTASYAGALITIPYNCIVFEGYIELIVVT